MPNNDGHRRLARVGAGRRPRLRAGSVGVFAPSSDLRCRPKRMCGAPSFMVYRPADVVGIKRCRSEESLKWLVPCR